MDARALGVTDDRLRGTDLDKPFHGVRSLASTPRLDAYRPLLRAGERFSHTTALSLWDAPLPERVAADLHVSLRRVPGQPRLEGSRTAGVIGHVSTSGRPEERRGVPVSDPITAFLESASLLEVDELVAVGDHLVLDPRVLQPGDDRPYASVTALREATRSSRGRGALRARAAASMVRTGVESPKETTLRLLLMRAGFPEATCGFELLSGRRRIGWFDLAWPEFKVIAEYDGDGHRTSTSQYDRDIRRFDDAAELDWRVIRVRIRGLGAGRADTVARVKRALTRGGWSSRSVPVS